MFLLRINIAACGGSSEALPLAERRACFVYACVYAQVHVSKHLTVKLSELNDFHSTDLVLGV